MKRTGLLSFLFCFSFAALAQANVDLFLDAIEQNNLMEVSGLIKKLNFDESLSPEQVMRLQESFKKASPEMIDLLGRVGTKFLANTDKQKDLDQLVEASNETPVESSFMNGLVNNASSLVEKIGKDPKVWFYVLLQAAYAFQQNATEQNITDNNNGYISQNDLDDLLYWSRCTFILSWTLVAILVIAPTAASCIYCCCGKK